MITAYGKRVRRGGGAHHTPYSLTAKYECVQRKKGLGGTSHPICMCVFGGGVAYGKGGVSLSGNGWVGPERRKEKDN